MKRLLLIALAIPALALAELTPPKGDYDPRVRVVDYNAMNVVKLTTYYGVSTQVQFADDEVIKDVAIGDEQAWKVVPRGNHIFIKPQATNADTNITVVSNKRTYQFALVVLPRPSKETTAWADPNLIYSLTFRYPEDDLAKRMAETKDVIQEVQGKAIKFKLADVKNEIRNYDYWVAGSNEISPTAAHDDGRFIYLTFSNNRDMPAVYSVDSMGNNEALINTNVVDGNTIVIQRLVEKLILRKGELVASVINKSFSLNGGTDNDSGTVSPDVERVIKETGK